MPIKNSEQTEQSKKDVDRHLLAEALSEDRELTDYPLRHSRSTLQWQEGIPTQLIKQFNRK